MPDLSIVAFWVLILYILLHDHESSGGPRHFHPDDGKNMLIQSISNYLQYYSMSQPRRPQPTSSSVWCEAFMATKYNKSFSSYPQYAADKDKESLKNDGFFSLSTT